MIIKNICYFTEQIMPIETDNYYSRFFEGKETKLEKKVWYKVPWTAESKKETTNLRNINKNIPILVCKKFLLSC